MCEGSLTKLTPAPLTYSDEFQALVEKVQQDDYAVASEEHELGVDVLAMDLRNVQAGAVGALNVAMSGQPLMAEATNSELMWLLLQTASRKLLPLL